LRKAAWYKDVSNLFLFIFLFSVLSGAIRKWIVGDGGVANIILGVQLLIPFVFLLAGKEKFLRIFNNRVFTFYLAVLVIEAFNPMNLTFFHGLFGILIHSAFWIGIFYYFENRDSFFVEHKLRSIIIMAVSLLVLAYIQYGLPPSHVLNKYVNEKLDGGVATVGKNVRITGTFSYISGFTAYLIFHAFLVWGLIKLNYKAIVVIGLMAGGLIAAFMSGSRTGTYSYIIFISLIFIYEFRKVNISRILAQLFIPAVIVFAFFALKGTFGDVGDNVKLAYDNFDTRRNSLNQTGEEKKRLFLDLDQVLYFKGENPVFGIGLGSTYQGAIALYGLSEHVRAYGYVESELARYVLEGGFILLFCKIILALSMARKLAMPLFTKAIIVIMLFSFNPIVYNIFNSVFTMLGIILIDHIYYKTKYVVPEDDVEQSLEPNNA
jgi:hypothetical protein